MNTIDQGVMRATNDVVEAVLGGTQKAVKYLSPTLVVRATKPKFKRRSDSRTGTIVLTVGRPNYAHRQFIKKCKKAGEPFPVKRVQLKFATKR